MKTQKVDFLSFFRVAIILVSDKRWSIVLFFSQAYQLSLSIFYLLHYYVKVIIRVNIGIEILNMLALVYTRVITRERNIERPSLSEVLSVQLHFFLVWICWLAPTHFTFYITEGIN